MHTSTHAIKQAATEDDTSQILAALAQGKTRETVAKEWGYTNYRSLDTRMRRKGYRWNAAAQTYERRNPAQLPRETVEMPVTQKVGKVVASLRKDGADPKTVAKQLGFTDHLVMAQYMKGHGYRFDPDVGNYVRQYGQLESATQTGDESTDAVEREPASEPVSAHDTHPVTGPVTADALAPYLPLLALLQQHQDQWMQWLVPDSPRGQVPRFVVPGTMITKSVHMSNLLDLMVRDYSVEKHLSQRDIVQTALLEFFRKYGYEQQVEALLRS